MSRKAELASVRKKGTRWQCRWREADGTERSETFSTKADAEDKRRDIESRQRDGSWIGRNDIDVESWLVEWLARKELEGLAPGTLEQYRSAVRRLCEDETLARTKLQALSARHVRQHIVWLGQPGRNHRSRDSVLSATTRAHTVRVLVQALQLAVEEELVARNVAKSVRVKRNRPQPKAWTPAQLHTFLEQVKGDRLEAVWHLLASTGARRGEVLALRWSDLDVDLGDPQVTRITKSRVMAKGGMVDRPTAKTSRSNRTVVLDAVTAALLRHYRESCEAERRLVLGEELTTDQLLLARIRRQAHAAMDESYVVCDELGCPLHPDSLGQRFQTHARRAGLPALGLHSLRHTHATLLLAAGIGPVDVAARLGHASPATTLSVYAASLPGAGEATAARFRAVLERGL